MALGVVKSLAGFLLLLNLCMFVIVAAIADWVLNNALEHAYSTAAVVGATSCLSGLLHLGPPSPGLDCPELDFQYCILHDSVGFHTSGHRILILLMAIPKAAAVQIKWMEMAPPRKICVGRRRPFEKTLLPIAEERSLSNRELMDGLCSAFPAVRALQLEGDNGRLASGES